MASYRGNFALQTEPQTISHETFFVLIVENIFLFLTPSGFVNNSFRCLCGLLKVFGAGPSIFHLILGVHRRSRIMWQHWQESSCHSGGQARRPQGVPCLRQCPHALLARPPPAASRCTLRGGGLHWLPFLRRHLGHCELRELSLTIFTSEEPVVDKDFSVIIMIEKCLQTAWYHDWPKYESGLRHLSTGWNREADKHLHCCCTSTKYKYTCSQAQKYTSTSKHHYIAKDKYMLYIATELCSPSLHCVDKQLDQLRPQLTNSTLQTISLRRNWANARLRGPIITCYLLPQIFQCFMVFVSNLFANSCKCTWTLSLG